MALDVIARSVLHSNSAAAQDVLFQMRLWDRLQLVQGPREQAACVRQAGFRRVHSEGRGDHPALARVHDDRTSAGEVRRYHARTLQESDGIFIPPNPAIRQQSEASKL